ncbi:MAG: hypothetical protein Alpg2KO_19010 [Alphaproteobacteria bacterium]
MNGEFDMRDEQGGKTFRRKVFYVAGYHRIPFKYYLKQIRQGIPLLEQVEGRSIRMTTHEDKAGKLLPRLDLLADGPDGATETSYSFLGATRPSLKRILTPGWRKTFELPINALKTLSVIRLLVTLWRKQWTFYLCVAFGFGVALFYLAALAGLGAWLGGWALSGFGPAAHWLGSIGGGVAGALISGFVQDYNNQKFHHRLVVDCIQMKTDWVNGKAPEFDELIDQCTDQVAEEIASGQWDEVLIVGHSIGGVMSVQIVDRLIARDRVDASVPLSMLTLGAVHVVPCGLTADNLHHQALRRVCNSDRLDWHEVFSPRDPLNVPYKSPSWHYLDKSTAPLPKMHSLKIMERVDAQTYKRLKWSPWEMHFAYLQEVERPAEISLLRCMVSARPLSQNLGVASTTEQEDAV